MRYIICYSGGKDSTATVILHYLNKKDEIKDSEIIFSEVMFDKNRGISGENPLHIDFILNKTFPLFESWGYKTRILRSEKDYLDCFYHKVTRSKYPDRIGKYRGFPIAGMCSINRDCKVRAIKKYLKNKNDRTEYIGIAADEQKRLERLKDYQSSILNEYGYTEKMAYDLCEEYDLLSPIYKISNRGGVAGSVLIATLNNLHMSKRNIRNCGINYTNYH